MLAIATPAGFLVWPVCGECDYRAAAATGAGPRATAYDLDGRSRPGTRLLAIPIAERLDE